MNDLFRFLGSQAGRYARIGAGVVLLVVGILLGGTIGTIIAIIGLVPLLAGMFDFCVFAPLAGLPFRGRDLRYALNEQPEQADTTTTE